MSIDGARGAARAPLTARAAAHPAVGAVLATRAGRTAASRLGVAARRAVGTGRLVHPRHRAVASSNPASPTLAVAMMAQDAAHLLPGALAPGLLALADEVVVLDGGSRDETAAVARGLGAKVVSAPFPVARFGEQQTRAVHECSSDWVLVLDADEVASSALLAQLPDLIRSRRRSGWWLPRRWAVPLGSGVAWIDQPPHWPDYQPRLARRIPALRYVGAIHPALSSGSPGSWGLAHDAPLVHLDLVVNDHRARSQKVAQRTGTPGFRGTEAFYLWEDTPTALAALDADEHETLAALARVLGSRGVA